ncbi:MAG: GNAT family N-acetyltransferase [Phycisphaerae bacterium]|nr:GNAT family N-acetyltransferase [Phycisphaerae bacterium]
MTFAERRIVMKDGRPAVIRPVRMSDAESLAACNRSVIAAGTGMTRELSQCAHTPEEVEAHARELVSLAETGAGIALAAIVGDEVGGAGMIRRQPRRRVRHVGHIGVGIAPAFQGLGLGRAIMEGLIAWARAQPNNAVSRVDLFVFADNVRAIRLYESLGFVVEGRRRRAVRYEDGRETDDLIMGLLL